MSALDNLSVKIDADAMQALVTKAIMEGLDEQAREQILTEAVKALTVAKKDPYGYSREDITPIQAAFDDAARNVAMRAAREVIEQNTELMVRIKALVAEALEQLLVTRSALSTTVAEGIRRAVESWMDDNR